jgi:hypothetical protein
MARSDFFATLRRAADTDDAKAIAFRMLKGLVDGRPELPQEAGLPLPPYPELGIPQLDGRASRRKDVVFITGRFRSGSTLLWNIFRNLGGCTAYYEPHNERRWFDPRSRGDHTDPSHRNVSDYWREYEGLEQLGDFYREEWTERHLYMDENFWDPDLKRYTEILIERAAGRPVLQCNRIDFRLPWVRKNFPNAKIIHLFRHPRDQWVSALMGDASKLPRDVSVEGFAEHDRFYLLRWAEDLKYHFPFLDPRAAEHPYQLFYYIWKLSYIFGRRYADYSLAFEHLVENPEGLLTEVFRVIGLDGHDYSRVAPLIVRPDLGRWSKFAEDDWYRRHEETCETVLHEFFNEPATRRRPH